MSSARLHGFAKGQTGRITIAARDLPEEVGLGVEDSGTRTSPIRLSLGGDEARRR